MNWKSKLITALTRFTEYKPLIKAEECIVGAINKLSEGPIEDTKEGKKVVEVV